MEDSSSAYIALLVIGLIISVVVGGILVISIII